MKYEFRSNVGQQNRNVVKCSIKGKIVREDERLLVGVKGKTAEEEMVPIAYFCFHRCKTH